jgi:6-phosphogluconolactonase
MADIYKPHIFDCETKKAFLEGASGHLMDAILDTNSEQGIVRLGLSGGSSLVDILTKIQTEHGLPWPQIELYQLDERYVEPNSQDSNQHLIRQIFVDHLEDLKDFQTFKTNYPIEQVVSDYAEVLDSLDGPYFDTTVLGVGPDGHIASLFPDGQYLTHSKKTVIETIAPPEFAVAKRVSLTLESILNSQQIMLVILGQNKAHVLREMLEGPLPATKFPVKFLLAHPRLSIFHYPKDN